MPDVTRSNRAYRRLSILKGQVQRLKHSVQPHATVIENEGAGREGVTEVVKSPGIYIRANITGLKKQQM